MQPTSFTREALAKALSNDYTEAGTIQAKKHFDYFYRYLGEEGLQAATIVTEKEYVSRDFLHDFADYYVLCFQNYPKNCKRVHFFSTTVTEDMLNRALLGKQEGPMDIWDSYLGFIVVKPIPTTVIGFSLLRDRNFGKRETNGRQFWGEREYKIHFCGREISLFSLAFQEQDSVLAACATTAIWIMLSKASANDHTVLKSPSRITHDAGAASANGSRLFPNKGLSVSQICHAIQNSGLVSEVKEPDMKDPADANGRKYVSNLFAKKIIHAYSGLGIPIILVIRVPSENPTALHAIAVSGLRMQDGPYPTPSTIPDWKAGNIEQVFAHDDQWGPFVPIRFDQQMDLDTPWNTWNTKTPGVTRITNIIVPVYPKVRISYEDIEAIVAGIDRCLKLFMKGALLYNTVWDIQIRYSDDSKASYKSGIKNYPLSDHEKIYIVSKNMPRYLWVASCHVGPNKILEFTFDATDVSNGKIHGDMLSFLAIDQIALWHEWLQNNKALFQSKYTSAKLLSFYSFLLEKTKVEAGKIQFFCKAKATRSV